MVKIVMCDRVEKKYDRVGEIIQNTRPEFTTNSLYICLFVK